MELSRYIYADGCEHMLYEGEHGYMYEGKMYCDECFVEKIMELDADELAELIGSERITIDLEGEY